MRIWIVLFLTLLCQPAIAGITAIDAEQPQKSEKEQRAEVLARILSQFNGLDEFVPVGVTAAKCNRNQKPVTHGLLVGADKIGPWDRFWLGGPQNDTEFLRNALVGRGADEVNIKRLTGQDATYRGLTDAAIELLGILNCGDSVILHFSSYAFDAEAISASLGENGPFSQDEKTVSLGSLGDGGASLQEAQRWMIAAAPYIVLNQSETGKGDVLTAAALSELVTVFRNQGADVSVILDVSSAEAFQLDDRQAQVNVAQVWREVFVPEESYTAREPYRASLLAVGAGALSVYYGSEVGNPGGERRYPKGKLDRKTYGVFSFYLGSALLQAERTTALALARYIKEAKAGETQTYSFTSTAPDTEMVVEARRDTPLRKGGIRIIDPVPTRAAAALVEPKLILRGVVEASADTMVVTVNGQTAESSPDGNFSANIELKAGVNRIDVLAMTRDNQPITHSFELFFEGDMAALLGTGARYVVLIANQDYPPGSGLPALATPIGDAEALARVLTTQYGFQAEALTPEGETVPLFLRNATRLEIETVLYQIGRIAGAKDTVLIFYAGHGIYEQATQGAFWLPVDAKAGLPFSYLPAAAITDAILRIEAGNVLVISDSCYSGALLRGGDSAERVEGDRLRALQRLADKRSRIVIASGGNEPVLDGGGGGHSIFARALLTGLNEMDQDAFTVRELFDRYLLPMVVGASAQEPQYRPIERSGHEGGDVVFARSGD